MLGGPVIQLLAALLFGGAEGPEPQEPDKAAPPPVEKRPPQEEPAPPKDRPLPKDMTQEEPPLQGEETTFVLDLRLGGWWMGTFDALTPAGRRQIDSTVLFDTGVDLQAGASWWTITLTGDYAVGNNLRMEQIGILLGAKWSLAEDSLPIDFQVGIGPVTGRLDVDLTGFGSFRRATGFEARLDGVAWLQDNLGLAIWADFRQLSFKFEETVTSGQTRTDGATFAFGLRVAIRF